LGKNLNPKNRNIIVALAVIIVVALVAFFSLNHQASKKSTAQKTVKVGIMSGDKQDQEVWKSVAKTAKEKYDLKLKFVYFSDYNQPNEALLSGDIDVNAFQSYNYVKTWNKAHKSDIVAVGNTYITPMHIYSKEVSKLSDLKEGSTVAIPNDASNESRALFVLQSAGLPNTALKNGDIDLNAFQHYAFLNAWNKANDGDLKAIGNTTISPIRLYSKKITSLSQIKSGDTIAVPNDASNESRALYVLKNAGLIGLSVSGDTLATVKDINSNPKNLVIKELDAAQTPRALDSITAAVINDDFATTAKLTVEESIYTEPVNKDSEQWINIIVANKKDANNKIYKEVVKAYQTEATKKAIEKAYPDKRKIAAWGLKLD